MGGGLVAGAQALSDRAAADDRRWAMVPRSVVGAHGRHAGAAHHAAVVLADHTGGFDAAQMVQSRDGSHGRALRRRHALLGEAGDAAAGEIEGAADVHGLGDVGAAAELLLGITDIRACGHRWTERHRGEQSHGKEQGLLHGEERLVLGRIV